MRVWYFTHKGKVRQNNEDALLVGKEVIRREVMDAPAFKRWKESSLWWRMAWEGMPRERSLPMRF
jgi:serine/threonine protein phosphatase PrpC